MKDLPLETQKLCNLSDSWSWQLRKVTAIFLQKIALDTLNLDT